MLFFFLLIFWNNINRLLRWGCNCSYMWSMMQKTSLHKFCWCYGFICCSHFPTVFGMYAYKFSHFIVVSLVNVELFIVLALHVFNFRRHIIRQPFITPVSIYVFKIITLFIVEFCIACIYVWLLAWLINWTTTLYRQSLNWDRS